MKKEKLLAIIEGVIIAALGVLIAIFGGGAVLDTYIAIVCLVLGVAFAVVSIIAYANTRVLAFSNVFISAALIVLGIGLLVGWISFAVFIILLVLILMGLGFALIIHGIYSLSKKALLLGIGEIVFGALAVTFSFLYIYVPEFQQAFWIVVGILIALFGILLIVSALLDKKSKK